MRMLVYWLLLVAFTRYLKKGMASGKNWLFYKQKWQEMRMSRNFGPPKVEKDNCFYALNSNINIYLIPVARIRVRVWPSQTTL